ncbi:MAG: ATP-binding cassette domain-containing protein [Acholeplasmatales bacterium]|nr:MAG: ATP-binding cassette domain-containing protein [Acholeplasmatales bacterium]
MRDNKRLIVEDLTISFRTNQGLVRAVRGVSFDLTEGETLAIVGESGSGKSVTSRAIMGILAGNAIIDKGQILYEDQDLTKISEENFHKIRGDKIGMIFQDPMSSLNPIMRIGKQITEGMLINGKRLKRRYNALIHRSKMVVANAKAEKKRLRKIYWYDWRLLRRTGKINVEDHLEEVDDKKKALSELRKQYKQAKAAQNTIIKEGKPALIAKKKEAKATVKKEWKEARGKHLQIIKDVKAKLASASSEEQKKVYKQELAEQKENLRRIKRVTKKEAVGRALKVMDEVGIPEPKKRLKQYPFQFSGGMRQRIVIAIALTADPDILICDEPTTALDVTIQAQILELINKLKEERSLTVIFITHDLGVVANMADRVAVMYAGKIVEIGQAEEIFYNPKHPYTWALLSSVPDLKTDERLVSIPGTPPNMLFPPQGDAFADRSRYAMKIDFELEPPMFKLSDTHYAATWLLHKNAPKVEMPEIIQRRIEIMTKQTAKEVSER